MNTTIEPQVPQEKKTTPRYINRRERRAGWLTKYNNNRKPKGSGFIQMGIAWDGAVIFRPRRKKIKGWQKEALRNS